MLSDLTCVLNGYWRLPDYHLRDASMSKHKAWTMARDEQGTLRVERRKDAMNRRENGGGTRDPVEVSIEDALHPGDFISDDGGSAFVRNLDLMRDVLSELSASDPRRSVNLHESFLAGCQAKAEEIDDSSGDFGSFVGSLACSWVASR